MVRKDVIVIAALSAAAIALIAGGGAVVLWQASPGGWFSRVSDAPAYLRAGREARSRGDYWGAVEAISLALACDPGLVDAWLERAELRRGAADLEPALADFNRAIELDPASARAYLGRAQVMRGLGDDAQAMADLDRGLAISSEDDESLHFRAMLRHESGQLESALLDYDELLQRQPGEAVWRQERGLLLRDMGRYEEAAADFRRVIGAAPWNADAVLDLAWAQWGANDLTGADASCRKAISMQPRRAHAHLALGAVMLSAGLFEDSLDHFNRAKSFPTQRVEYACLLAWVARARANDAPGADALLAADLANEELNWRDWPLEIGRFLLGEVSEESLRSAAGDENDQATRELQCEALYYAAMKRAVTGDANGARRLLEDCVATEVRAFYEYNAALAELRRLDAGRE